MSQDRGRSPVGHPVIRGKLIIGDESLNLQADIAGGEREGVSSPDLWWPPQKIAGKYHPPSSAGVRRMNLGHPRARNRGRGLAGRRLAP